MTPTTHHDLPEVPEAPPLVAEGERIDHVTRYSREDISRFATLTLDRNPVHHDAAVAQRARHGDIIASGQHTSALMSGLAATYFSRDDDGLAREMLCLNFNFSYRAPIFAERDVHLEWTVTETEWSDKLGGCIAQLVGRARVGDETAVIARGTVLVRKAT